MPPTLGRVKVSSIFELSPQYQEVIDDCEKLAEVVEPFAMEADESSELYEPVLNALRNSGLSSLMVPETYGGRFAQIDPLAVCLARERLMKTSSHLDSLFALQGIGSYAISIAGTNEQKENQYCTQSSDSNQSDKKDEQRRRNHRRSATYSGSSS